MSRFADRFAAAGRLALVLVVLASVQSYALVEASFALNREAIAARYCVNRDRPELHCEGRCELSRRLEAQREREQSRETALLGVALSATMWLAPTAGVEAPAARPVPAYARPSDERGPAGTPVPVFHPPRQA